MSNTANFLFKNKPEIIWNQARKATIDAAYSVRFGVDRDDFPGRGPANPITNYVTPLFYESFYPCRFDPRHDLATFLHNRNIGKFTQYESLPAYLVHFGEIIGPEHSLYGKVYRASVSAGMQAFVDVLVDYGVL